ncbi:MAG: hypothetical protein NTU83_04725, partial [Candidatus Hydrogenedentes bacterium]|nr:hypothetical protein [Candidatus Hydrogenedentota bacterium]
GVNMTAVNSAANPGSAAFTASSGVAQWTEDGAVDPYGYVGPGYGGQNFDIEAMYAYADSSGLYVAVVTGFDKTGVYGWVGGSANGYSEYDRPGDIFLDFGSNGTYDVAIETAGLSQGTQTEAWGGTAGHAYKPVSGSTWYTNPTDFPASTPSEIIHTGGMTTDLGATGGFSYSDATPQDNLVEGGLPHASSNANDWNRLDHNVIELYLSNAWLTQYGFNASNGVSVLAHLTE